MLEITSALRTKLFSLDGERFASAFALFNRLRWRLPITIEYDPQDHCYVATDLSVEGSPTSSIAFSKKERVWVYAKGVHTRVLGLGKVYGVDACDIDASDTVIDCGANVGEFSSLMRSRFGCSVIAVEPEPEEARCIRRNVPGVRDVVNAALWNETKELTFYSKNRSADSSLFETAGYDAVTTIQAFCLDDIFDNYGLEHVKFFKLEAEGAEPEILIGASRSIPRISYISADLGPERGLQQESTVVPVCNFLFKHGFELMSVYPRRQVYLFRNKRA